MDPLREQRVASIFQAALHLSTSEREELLARECRDDSGLRRGVEELLAADAAADRFLKPPSINATTPASGRPLPIDGPPPDAFAGYQLVREIHRGGQGVVYQAIHKTTKRKVAIKVMREGPFAGVGDRARFEREVQVLGQLNHPSIVAVHDTGVAAGCHYFVMDYVAGQPLDQWMSIAGLGVSDSSADGVALQSKISKSRRGDQSPKSKIRDALRLFAKICDAVNTAHLHGVIHRDLKPSNIRVDEHGEPHILDFGLAKVATPGTLPVDLDGSSGDVVTLTGQFIGSLPWASPEQAEGSASKIDVRTDVYSLGVILYQMLTGKFPYDVAGNMRDVFDRILRATPARPSTVRRQINDEVETIVLKCLQKDRERRYQSAGELGRDVRHYLAGEPIEAKRDSFGYVLRKQLRRYWLTASIVGAFAFIITVGLIAALALWRQAALARDEALAARAEATQQAATASAVNAFLGELLAAADPRRALGPGVSVADVLKEADRRLANGELTEQPVVEASLHHILGRTYAALMKLNAAATHLQRAVEMREKLVGPRHPEFADSLVALARVFKDQGRAPEAAQLVERALAIYRADAGTHAARVAETLNALAGLRREAGRVDDAGALLREARGIVQTIAAVSTQSADIDASLAALLLDLDRPEEAVPLYRSALATYRALLDPEHPFIAITQNNLAGALRDLGQSAEAEPLVNQALDALRAVLETRHPHIAAVLHHRALVLHDRNQLVAAEEDARAALEIRTARLPDDHWLIANTRSALGGILADAGRFDEAEPLLLESQTSLAGAAHVAPRFRRAAIERIIALYENWERPDDAATWRRRLADSRAAP